MHFRQRVAWLLLAAYLTCTGGGLYYVFEISTQLRMFAVDHVDQQHTILQSPLRPHAETEQNIVEQEAPSVLRKCLEFVQSLFSHIFDIPVPVLAVLFFTIYMQIFCVLWMYTRPEAHCVISCFWPVQLYAAFKSFRAVNSGREPQKSPLSLNRNGSRTTVA